MSDLENNAQEKGTKKRPYNLREKKEKDAAYRSLIRPELADELYDKILNIVVVQRSTEMLIIPLRIWRKNCRPILAICLQW